MAGSGEPIVNPGGGRPHRVLKGDSHLTTTNNLPSRARLFGGSASIAVAAMLIAGPAFAQAATAAAAADTDDSTIIVTGSLIKNPNLTRSAPVNVTTSEEITLKQSNVAEDLLRDIPGVVPNVGSAVNNGNGGASFIDLRGLGSNRNIVLLDGARIAPSGLVGRVDLNNIPLSLVERVEVLTDGAPSACGIPSGVVLTLAAMIQARGLPGFRGGRATHPDCGGDPGRSSIPRGTRCRSRG